MNPHTPRKPEGLLPENGDRARRASVPGHFTGSKAR